MEKFHSLRESIVNLVGAHPRVFTVLAGVGISFTFATIGRFFVHEALAITSQSVTSSVATTIDTAGTFQVDYVDNTHISKIPGHVTNVAFLTQCQECAGEFAPGTEAENPGDAQNFAPGHEANSPGDAQDLSPGHLKKKELP